MECKVNGEKVRLELVSCRDLNFGEESPGVPAVDYELFIPIEEFAAALRGFYEDFAEDDRVYGTDDEAELILKLRSLKWPALADLAQGFPEVFCQLVLEYMAYDALQTIFSGREPATQKRYVINSVRAVALEGKTVVFRGAALDVEAPRVAN
ncbi:MAG TPA: hypothetical protein VFZ08_13625 [Terriglobia bacterium]|nr:hypothetical protein [Terriglobia bacterium]